MTSKTGRIDRSAIVDFEFIYPRLMAYAIVVILFIVYFQPVIIYKQVIFNLIEIDLKYLNDFEYKYMLFLYYGAIISSIISSIIYSTTLIKKYRGLAQLFNIFSAGFGLILIYKIVTIRNKYNKIISVGNSIAGQDALFGGAGSSFDFSIGFIY